MKRWETVALVAVVLLACGGAALWVRDAVWCADLNGELHMPRAGRAVCIVNERVIKP